MKTKTILQSYAPVGLLVIAGIFLLSGIFTVIAGNLLGFVAIGIATVICCYWDGTEIDFAQGKIREFSALGPIRFGDWQAIHPDKELQIRSLTMAHSRTTHAMQTHSYQNNEFKLMLKMANGKFALIKRSAKKAELEQLEEEVRRGMGEDRK